MAQVIIECLRFNGVEFSEGLCSILSIRAVNALLDSSSFSNKAIIWSFDELVEGAGWFKVAVLPGGSCK